MADQVAEMKALDAPPFDLEFRRASAHVPKIDESAVQVNLTLYKDVIEEVEALERHMTAVYAANTPAATDSSRVHFGTGPAAGNSRWGPALADPANASSPVIETPIQDTPGGLVDRSADDYDISMLCEETSANDA